MPAFALGLLAGLWPVDLSADEKPEARQDVTELRVVPVEAGEARADDDAPARGYGLSAGYLLAGPADRAMRNMMTDAGFDPGYPLLSGRAFEGWFEPLPSLRVGAYWHLIRVYEEQVAGPDRLQRLGFSRSAGGATVRHVGYARQVRWTAGGGVGLGQAELQAGPLVLQGAGRFDDQLAALRNDTTSDTWSRTLVGAGPALMADLAVELPIVDWLAASLRGGWQVLWIPADSWRLSSTGARLRESPAMFLHGWRLGLDVVVGRFAGPALTAD